MSREIIELKVSSSSNVADLAAAIVGIMLENRKADPEILAIGAGALNQAIKGIIRARGLLASSASEKVVINPYFKEVTTSLGEKRTAIACLIERI